MMKTTTHFFEITNDKLHFTRSGKKINLKEIILLKSKVNYTNIYLRSGKILMIPRTIKLFDTLLCEHGFVRTHRSFLINNYHIKEYNLSDNYVRLTNNLVALISRRRKDMIGQRNYLTFQLCENPKYSLPLQSQTKIVYVAGQSSDL